MTVSAFCLYFVVVIINFDPCGYVVMFCRNYKISDVIRLHSAQRVRWEMIVSRLWPCS